MMYVSDVQINGQDKGQALDEAKHHAWAHASACLSLSAAPSDRVETVHPPEIVNGGHRDGQRGTRAGQCHDPLKVVESCVASSW